MLYCVTHSKHQKAWPLGLILRAVYSCGKPIPVAKGKRFALGVDLNEKNRSGCVASLTLCRLAEP